MEKGRERAPGVRTWLTAGFRLDIEIKCHKFLSKSLSDFHLVFVPHQPLPLAMQSPRSLHLIVPISPHLQLIPPLVPQYNIYDCSLPGCLIALVLLMLEVPSHVMLHTQNNSWN